VSEPTARGCGGCTSKQLATWLLAVRYWDARIRNGTHSGTEMAPNVTAALEQYHNYEKALGETQTLRAGCSKAEPKIFAPPQTPSRGRRTAKI